LRTQNVDDELTALLDTYLNLPSGLENSDKTEAAIPISIFDTFVNMITTPQTSKFYGHAVTIQNIFESNIEEEALGPYYCKIKNTWGIEWGLNGYLIVPIKIFWYASVIMFDTITVAAKLVREAAKSNEPFMPRPAMQTYISAPNLKTATIIKQRQRQLNPRLPAVFGGKRSRKKHRKRTYRKKHRKTKQKKSYRKKHRKMKSKNLK